MLFLVTAASAKIFAGRGNLFQTKLLNAVHLNCNSVDFFPYSSFHVAHGASVPNVDMFRTARSGGPGGGPGLREVNSI